MGDRNIRDGSMVSWSLLEGKEVELWVEVDLKLMDD